MDPTRADLERIRAVYEEGKYVSAWNAAKEIGDPLRWSGTEARVLSGRLAPHVGAMRQGMVLHLRAFRSDPKDPVAAYYASQVIYSRKGPWPTLRFLDAFGEPDGCPDGALSDLLTARATAVARLRDFAAADRLLSRAEELTPGNAWISVERSWIRELEDRYEEALAEAREALTRRPLYRPAVQALGRALILLGRDREALDVLTDAAETIESGHLVRQIVDLQTELGLFAEAKENVGVMARLWPEAETASKDSISCLESDLAYLLGDTEEAVEHARGVKHHFYQRLVENLEAAPPDAKRILLYVPFIRQHHMTCGAATIAGIADFWSRPADHETVANEIVYDGSRPADERKWCLDHGWKVVEFTLSWDATVALIDRGVPFALTTAEPSSSHLQTVVGYDARRGTLLVRDPTNPSRTEFLAKETGEFYAAVGPRAMAIVPKERADLIADLDLPDAALYDENYDLQRALLADDRAAAEAAWRRMGAIDESHAMTLEGELSLAYYDRAGPTVLHIIDRLLEKFPDSAYWEYRRLPGLWNLGRRDEHLELLERLTDKGSGSVFREQYAQALYEDAGRIDDARREALRSIRSAPGSGTGYYILGRVYRAQRRFQEAYEAFRTAACLELKNERFVTHWFRSARQLGRTEEALATLVDRVERFGAKSAAPAITLFDVLEDLDRVGDAFSVLDEALASRPDDGELLLFAARNHARWGRLDRATELLDRARDGSREGEWLRCSAEILRMRGDPAGSFARWREVATLEPLAMDAIRRVAQGHFEAEGRARTLEWLDALHERFPQHVELTELRLEWLAGADPKRREAAADAFVAMHPRLPNSHAELASVLIDLGRFDEAIAAVDRAEELHPDWFGHANRRARALLLSGKADEAAEEFRRSIRLDVDSEFAIHQLFAMTVDQDERRAVAEFVRDELLFQRTQGGGLTAWRNLAQDTLDGEQILDLLEDIAERRPELRRVKADIARQLRDMDRIDDAWNAIETATEENPLVPELWTLRAELAAIRMDADAEMESLDHAIAIRPGWSTPLRMKAIAHERQGDYESSLAISERAVARNPADAWNHGYVADALWHLDRREEAVANLRRAVTLDPDYEWAWDMLVQWEPAVDSGGLAIGMARELAETRPGEAENWLRLHRLLSGEETFEERLAALDRAEALEPLSIEVHDARVRELADAERYKEAIAACRPAAFGDRIPIFLRGREIWIEAARGRVGKAMKRMERLLEEDETYEWGWARLWDWAEDEDDEPRKIRAAENLVRLGPNNPEALSRLGEVREAAGDAAGAREVFERASLLRPTHRLAGWRSFRLSLDAGDLDHAEVVLERIRPHFAACESHACRAMVAGKRGDVGTAEDALRRITVIPDAEVWSLDRAQEAVEEANGNVERALASGAQQPEFTTMGASRLVRRLANAGRFDDARAAISDLEDRDDHWMNAVDVFLSVAGDRTAAKPLKRVLDHYAERIRKDTTLWGRAGYALSACGRNKDCVLWHADWREREGAEPWMLSNHAFSLRIRGDDAESAEVSRHALTLDSDVTTRHHELWLAMDAALGGDYDQAEERMGRIDPDGFDPIYGVVFRWVRVLLDLAACPKRERGLEVPSSRRKLDFVFTKNRWMHGSPLAKRLYVEFVRRIRRLAPTFGTFAWSVLRAIRLPGGR